MEDNIVTFESLQQTLVENEVPTYTLRDVADGRKRAEYVMRE
jgi:hypothetical protein